METSVLIFQRRVYRPLLVTGLFVLLACVNSYPLVLSLDSKIGQHGDAFFSVWRLAWVAHQIRADPGRLFDANIFFPESNALAYSDAMLLPALAVAPLNWAGVSPLTIYNLTLLTSFVVSGVAAFALVRYLTDSTPGALLGGVLFAYSPHRLEHFDHLELQFAFWIPLAVLAWHRAVERDEPGGYLRVAALGACQILSSIYHGVFLLTWLAVMTGVWFWRTPRRALRAGLLSLAPAVVVLGIYSLPYLKSREAVGERPRKEVSEYSARPADFLSAPANNRVYGWTDSWGANERHLFPGFVALVFAGVGLWSASDRRIRLHGLGLALAVVMMLGFNGGLYNVLYEWVLPYRGLRVPARAAILMLMGNAVLAGAGVAWMVAHLRSKRTVTSLATLVVAMATVECLAAPPLIDVGSDTSEWYPMLRGMPEAVVFEWPVTVPWRLHIMRDVQYMYRSTQHWRPLLNGYSGNYPRSYLDLLYEMRAFPYTSALSYLKRRGATVLVVHEDAGSKPTYDEAIERLHRDPSIRVIAVSHDAGSRVTFFSLLPEGVPLASTAPDHAVR
jgi:hypothetical protein